METHQNQSIIRTLYGALTWTGLARPGGGVGVERPPNNWKFFDFNFFFTRVNIQKY
jgi:hypothetical protein